MMERDSPGDRNEIDAIVDALRELARWSRAHPRGSGDESAALADRAEQRATELEHAANPLSSEQRSRYRSLADDVAANRQT